MEGEKENFEEQRLRYEKRREEKKTQLNKAGEKAPTIEEVKAAAEQTMSTLDSLRKLEVSYPTVMQRMRELEMPEGIVEFDSVPQLMEVFRGAFAPADLPQLVEPINAKTNIVNSMKFADGRFIPARIRIRLIREGEGFILHHDVQPVFYPNILQAEQRKVLQDVAHEFERKGYVLGFEPLLKES